MNLLFGFIDIIVVFSLVVIIEKLFKKEGLYVFITMALILANLVVGKMIDIGGFTTSLGNTLFASTFLATDILVEKYSRQDAKKAIYISVFCAVAFIIITQLTLAFTPSKGDAVNSSMKVLFDMSFRTLIASIVMYFISNMVDIHIYNKLKEKYPDKLWLRNNVATIISNCTENFFFAMFAFLGIYDISAILSIAITKTVIEIILAICDTPFLYLSRKLK